MEEEELCYRQVALTWNNVKTDELSTNEEKNERIIWKRLAKDWPKSLARWGHSAAYHKECLVIFGGRK